MLRTVFRSAALWRAAVGIVVSANAQAGQWQDHFLEHGGKTRLYRSYVPTATKPNAPSVVVLHGGGQSMRKIFAATGGANLAWIAVADREGVVLLVPNGTNRDNGDPAGEQQNWNDLRADTARAPADDVGFIKRMLQTEQARLKLDTKRSYVTGASNGGMMSMRLLIESPELFAGAATFIANLPHDLGALPKPSRPAPIMMLNGTADALVPFGGGLVANDATRGSVASTSATLAWWLGSNKARWSAERSNLPDADPKDNCTINLAAHEGGSDGAAVWLYTAQGGGHSMPSIVHKLPDTPWVRRIIGNGCRDVESAELAWAFFAIYGRKPN